MIIACFAGVGKNYAIEELRKKYKVLSIEKERDFYLQYPSREKYVRSVLKAHNKYDFVFIPYFLKMDERYISGGFSYYICYPNENLKSEYLKRYKEMNFTKDQIDYLDSNFYKMIVDIRNSDGKPLELTKKDEYLLDKIYEIIQ